MGKVKGRMDESILVCVYYGPNGERLIRRGHQMASAIGCPLYVLTVDPLPLDDMDADKSDYIDRWRELAEELNVDEFIIRDNERRPTAKVIKKVAHDHNITQIIIGQTAQSRWEEITKGSFMNVLLREITFVDFHVVSVARSIKHDVEGLFEKGLRAYLTDDTDGYRITFNYTRDARFEGIFFKETGTDFNNGIFKFMHDGKMCQVRITDDCVEKPSEVSCKIEQ